MSDDITRFRGDTYPMEFVVESNGSPLNITGATFVLTVDPSKAPTNSATKLFSINGVITSAVGGAISFTPSPVQADNLGKYFYDLQMTDGSGLIRTVKTGKYILIQDITKV